MAGSGNVTADEVTVLELEAAADLLRNAFPPDGWRPPSPVEVASTVDFAAVASRLDGGQRAAVKAARTARSGLLTAVQADLAAQGGGLAGMLRRLAGYTSGAGVPAPLVNAVSDATRRGLTDVLTRVAQDALADVVDETARSGLDAAALPRALSPALADTLAATAELAAGRVVDHATRALVDAAYTEPYPAHPDDPAQVAHYLRRLASRARAASTRGLDDVAAQAVNAAQGLARAEATAGLTDAGSVAYASELLDANCCAPCRAVDGTAYPSHAAARADYPAGRYRACLGGDRCRGQLIYLPRLPVPPAGRDVSGPPQVRSVGGSLFAADPHKPYRYRHGWVPIISVTPGRYSAAAVRFAAADVQTGFDPGGADSLDTATVRLADALGFTGQARRVTEQEIVDEAAGGGVELWRGSKAAYNEQLTSGAYVAPLGIFGSGIYTAEGGPPARDLARGYAAADPDSSVAHLSLPASAHIADGSELERLVKERKTVLRREARALPDSPAGDVRDHEIEQELAVLGDPGRAAMAFGYDAIRYADSSGPAYVLVLNRSALLVAL